jgi:predicted small secreted protein
MKKIKLGSLGLFAGLISAMLLAACNNSSGGGSQPAPAAPVSVAPVVVQAGFGTIAPFWATGCTGCFAAPQVILSGVKVASALGDVTMTVDLLVPQSSYINWSDTAAIVKYNGPVAIQGIATVTGSGGSTFCGIPAGTYNISTTTVGQLIGEQVQGVVLQINGAPSMITISMYTPGQLTTASPSGVVYQGGANSLLPIGWVVNMPANSACLTHYF